MSPARMDRFESSIRIVLEFNEAFNRHDVVGIVRMMSEDCVFEDHGPAPDGAVYRGKEAIAKFYQDFFDESPDTHIEIEDIFGFGFHCVMRWRSDGVDAAGTEGHLRGVSLFQVKDKSICEMLSYVKG